MRASDQVRTAAERLLQKLVCGLPVSSNEFDENGLFELVAQAVDSCLDELRELEIWGSENRVPSSELWNVAGHLLERGWLQTRARTKPRGYAGDHEMLAWIYERRLSEDPLGRCFDRYFQDQAAPQAVRNRMAMISDWIVAGAVSRVEERAEPSPLHVAVIGSAVGLEVRDALQRLAEPARQQVHVTLLDLDPAAIDFAKQQLAEYLPSERFTAVAANLFRLPDRPNAAKALTNCDLLFCPGLFDYLDDNAARLMLRTLYERLASGGRLFVFQFAPDNPTRAYMEWFGNWYLMYRDLSEFRRIVKSAALPDAEWVYGSEPLGIDLFVVAMRPFG